MSRGRVITAWSATASAAVLITALFAARDRIAEAWNLHRLRSADAAQRFQAAKRLGELRSAKAAPGLIDLLKALPDDAKAARAVWGSSANAGDALAGVLGEIGPPVIAPLARAIEESRGERKPWRRYACRALGLTRAEAAVLPLIAALDDQDTCVRLSAFQVLESMGASACGAVGSIQDHLEDPNRHVRDAAARALSRIQAASSKPAGATWMESRT